MKDRADKKLRKIKLITEWRFEYLDDENLKRPGYKAAFEKYDTEGKLTSLGAFDSLGTPYSTSKITYNSAGQIKKHVRRCEGCSTSRDHKFDLMGNVNSMVNYDAKGNKLATVVFERDSIGNPTLVSKLRADTVLSTSTKYEYTEYGDTLNIITLDWKHNVIRRKNMYYNYDEWGDILRVHYLDENREVLHKATYKFDGYGNPSGIYYTYPNRRLFLIRQFKYEFWDH